MSADGGGFLPLPPNVPIIREEQPAQALPAPDAAALDTNFGISWFNPWATVRITSRDTGKVYEFESGGPQDDMLSLDTAKALGQPAGTWSLTLNPRRIPFGRRNVTWADLVRRNDHVEIAMGIHHTDPGIVVMRGFVDHCHRIDAADPQRGLPARRVLISGRDYGKLWLNFKVFYLQEASQYAGSQATNLMQIYWGILPGLKSPNTVLADIFAKLLQPKIARLQRGNAGVLQPTVACEVPDQFQISTKQSNFMTYTGSLWNLIDMFVSPPFTEFFVRDVPGAAAPEVRWRWAPLLKPGNRLALPWTPHPPVHTLHMGLVKNYDVDQTDNERYTYFWAPPGQYGTGATGLAVGKFLAPGYIDGPGIDQFGFNALEPAFQMYRMTASDDLANDDTTKTRPFWVPQINTNVQWLADTMLDNDELLDGQIQCHLRPDLVIGDYVDVPEEGVRMYIEGVSHSLTFAGQPSISTVVTVTRGRRLGDADIKTPDSYKYAPGTEIPGGSLSGSTPNETSATSADQAASAASAASPGGNAANAPAPPFMGEAQAQATIRLAQSLVGVADYAEGRRNIDKGSDVRITFAAICTPGPQNAAGDHGGGIDCSELVEWSLRYGASIKLPAPAQTQYNSTPRVPYNQLQPGDVVFFGGTVGGDVSGNNISHSGLYIGGGQMINAQDVGQKVKVADLSTGYWQQHFVSGGRVFTPPAPGGAGGVPNQH